jgi:hypothetical protein
MVLVRTKECTYNYSFAARGWGVAIAAYPVPLLTMAVKTSIASFVVTFFAFLIYPYMK